MSTIFELPQEIIKIIVNLNNINYNPLPFYSEDIIQKIINLRRVCREFNKVFNFMPIKIERLDISIYSLQTEICISTEHSLCKRPRDYYNFYNSLRYCVNSDCDARETPTFNYNFRIHQRKNYMLGMMYFYYPNFINQDILKSPRIKISIPYCEDCMLEFCNIEKQLDGSIIPYGDDVSLYV
jgi:hypothetical protein